MLCNFVVVNFISFLVWGVDFVGLWLGAQVSGSNGESWPGLVSSYAISFQPLPKYFTQNAVHITAQWLEFSVIVECKTNIQTLHWKLRHVSKILSTTPAAPLHPPKISDVVDGNYEAGFYKSVSALQVTACQQNFSSHLATNSPPPKKT